MSDNFKPQVGDLTLVTARDIVEYLAAGEPTLVSDAALNPRSCASAIAAQLSDAEILAEVAGLIDHTILKPDAARGDIEQLCADAVRFAFASVCVNPWYVPQAAAHVRGSAVEVCTVVGFPLGATTPRVKVYEAAEAIAAGAREIDMVQNVGALKSGADHQVEADIQGVVDVCHRSGAICKVILEMALLTPDEKVRACLIAQRAGADYVKTSTGFAAGGAAAEDVRLMRATVGADIGIKAAGGIRSFADLRLMVLAGATRIGTSAGLRILQQVREAAAEMRRVTRNMPQM